MLRGITSLTSNTFGIKNGAVAASGVAVNTILNCNSFNNEGIIAQNVCIFT